MHWQRLDYMAVHANYWLLATDSCSCITEFCKSLGGLVFGVRCEGAGGN
jgi:hypothetical protein